MELNQVINLMSAPTPATFDGLFRRASAKVRLQRALRTTLTGLSAGLSLGTCVAGGLWLFRLSPSPAYAGAAAAVLGAVAGALVARYKRWSDQDVALFLDARFDSPETVTSALALHSDDSERAQVIRQRAERALLDSPPRAARLRLLLPVHGLSLAGVIAIALFSLVPSPLRASATPPSSPPEALHRGNVKGLERIEALEHAEGVSDADAERLRKLARDARELQKDLTRGIPKREALSRVGRLRDDLAREREHFSDAKERPGLESAVNALAGEAMTRRAAKALDTGDVVSFDEEMQRLAGAAEAASREKAKRALESARDAAKGKDSRRLAEFLERQRKLFEEREAASAALRELAKQLEGRLDAEQSEALRKFQQKPDLESLEALAEVLSDVLSELDEAERKRLLEQLAKDLSEGKLADPELAQKLPSKIDKDALREALRELASRDAARERSLDDAERGGAEAERGLIPIPLPGKGGRPSPSPSTGGPASGQPANGEGGSSPPGVASSPQPAEKLEEFRAKAEAKLLPGMPLGTRALGRAPARPGETADQAGTGKLGSVAPQEIGAVENSDVPEEYREHVGRYFQP